MCQSIKIRWVLVLAVGGMLRASLCRPAGEGEEKTGSGRYKDLSSSAREEWAALFPEESRFLEELSEDVLEEDEEDGGGETHDAASCTCLTRHIAGDPQENATCRQSIAFDGESVVGKDRGAGVEYLANPVFGPKEIYRWELMRMITLLVPDPESEVKVLEGRTLEIACLPFDKLKEAPNRTGTAKYHWFHRGEKIPKSGPFKVKVCGEWLKMTDARPKDSGNYTCLARYKDPITQVTTQEVHTHRVNVVELPRIVTKAEVSYETDEECRAESMNVFEELVAPQVEKNICPEFALRTGRCRIHAFRPKSLTPLSTKNGTHRISVVYQLEVGPCLSASGGNAGERQAAAGKSPEATLRSDVLAVIQLRSSLMDALSRAVILPTGIGLYPTINLENISMLIGCPGGFFLRDEGFCAPCGPDTFSKHLETKCSRCLPGLYQDVPASMSCKRCPNIFHGPNCFHWSGNMILMFIALLLWALVTYQTAHCFFHTAREKNLDWLTDNRLKYA